MDKSYSLITISYKGDLKPFEDLCKSIDLHMPDVRHYVLVDRQDVPLFENFASDRRIIVDCSKELPQFRAFEFMGRRLWWRPMRTIVRGWIYQQIAKIHFSAKLKDDAVVIVDSDAVFLRPITPEHLFSGERVKLYHAPGKPSGPPSESDKWHNVALTSFGLPATGYTGSDYVSTAVIWSPEVVRGMIAQIERATGKKWYDALTKNFRFSEYVLYGVFCKMVAGSHQDLIEVTEQELAHCSWHHDLGDAEGIDHFVRSMDPVQTAVLIQSNLRMPAGQRAEIMQRFREEYEVLPHAARA